MPDPHVPWRQRKPPTGWSARAGRMAAAAYACLAPPVRRFPGSILLGVLVLVGAGAASLGWCVRDASLVRETLVRHDPGVGDGWLAMDAIRRGRAAAGVWTPAWALYAAQASLVRDLVGLSGVVAFATVLVMFAIWWERKVCAFIQNRLGPMRVGGWHGWAQSIADTIKLLGKEDLIPAHADRPLFRLAPYLTLVPVLCAFVALPFGATWVLRELDIALLLILALIAVDILGVLIAGWASNNKWSVYGAMREACQVVSYEVPMNLSLLVPVMIAGSLSLREIAAQQAGGWANWLGWHSPWSLAAMVTFFVASLAACKRAPFDLPEAESELVAGFHTEYSGFRWSVFFFAEYNAMFLVSGVLVLLFLGGWDAPWAGLAPRGWAESSSALVQLAHGLLFSGPAWFILKCLLLVTLQMWVRWTLPRLRIDQVLYSCVQVLLPLTMGLVLLSAVWELLVRASPPMALVASGIRSLLAVLGAVGAIAIGGVAVVGMRRGRELVGPLALDRMIRGA